MWVPSPVDQHAHGDEVQRWRWMGVPCMGASSVQVKALAARAAVELSVRVGVSA
jgi:hypothetical protein